MKNIVIAGGSGLIGKNLAKTLLNKGYSVTILSRKEKQSSVQNLSFAVWDPENNILPERLLKEAHAIINLAGRNVGDKRWNKAFKQEIWESRIKSTQLLVDFYNMNTDTKLDVFINASATGYYGLDSDKIHIEEDKPGNDFMAEVCVAWEKAAHQLQKKRLVIYRFGIVLAKSGGALEELAKPIKFGAGAALGSGKQAFTWVHIADLCKMLLWAIENPKIEGVYNAVAPEIVSNQELTKEIAKKLHRPILLPNVPAFVLKLMLGEFAEALLGSIKVSADKIKSSGYKFIYPELENALEDIYGR
ncbi:MAG: TIGR01777 family oxidoreductase [Bacteroidia bacterium]